MRCTSCNVVCVGYTTCTALQRLWPFCKAISCCHTVECIGMLGPSHVNFHAKVFRGCLLRFLAHWRLLLGVLGCNQASEKFVHTFILVQRYLTDSSARYNTVPWNTVMAQTWKRYMLQCIRVAVKPWDGIPLVVQQKICTQAVSKHLYFSRRNR